MDSAPPDFKWPYEVTDRLVGWLGDQFDRLPSMLSRRPLLNSVLRAMTWCALTYLVLLWGCLCYIRFPIGPDISEVAEWLVFATGLIWGGIAFYVGAAQLCVFLWLLLLISLSLMLSLFYLCCVVWNAKGRQSAWLKRYRPTLLVGIVTVTILATFVDGSHRFWDRRFEVLIWVKLVLLGASAWSALFCHLMRTRASQDDTPRVIVKWTIGLAALVGVFVYWQSSNDRLGYLLRKNVVEHPNDLTAWLELSRHYKDQGDVLAADSGDEDSRPGDPTPFYEEALRCVNQAIALGANGFDVHFLRAQLADAVGKKSEAISFALETLRLTSSDFEPDEESRFGWLREMIARNQAVDEAATVQRIRRLQRARSVRRGHLPVILGWPFDLIEVLRS